MDLTLHKLIVKKKATYAQMQHLNSKNNQEISSGLPIF
jgi:hypothetical protein